MEVQNSPVGGEFVEVFPEQLMIAPQDASVFTVAIHTLQDGHFEDTLQLEAMTHICHS